MGNKGLQEIIDSKSNFNETYINCVKETLVYTLRGGEPISVRNAH